MAYQVSSRSDENKTAVFTLLASESEKATSFEENGLTATGVAVYPVASARPAAEYGNTMDVPYSQDIPIVKMQPEASTSISGVHLTGINDGTGFYNFSTAESVVKITVSHVHSKAVELSLCTADKEHYPVAGDFILSATDGKYIYSFGDGGTYKYYSDFPYKLSTTITPDSDDATVTAYFNLPVGTYAADKLSIKIKEEEGETVHVYSKKIAKPVVTRANELLELPALAMTYPSFSVSISGDANGPKLRHTTNYIRFCAINNATNNYAKYVDGQKFTSAKTNNEYSLTSATNTDGASLSTSGKYYLHYLLKANTGNSSVSSLDDVDIIEYGTLPFYYIASDDVTQVVGTFKGNFRYLPKYYSSKWCYISDEDVYDTGNASAHSPAITATDNNFIIATSDDPSKGNIMITNILGLGYDGTISAESFINSTLITEATNNLSSGTYTAGSPIYGSLSGSTITCIAPASQGAFVNYNGDPVLFAQNNTGAVTFSKTAETTAGTTTVTLTAGNATLSLPVTLSNASYVTGCLIRLQGYTGSYPILSRSYTE